MGASACSTQNDMRPRGYLQCAVTDGGADGYRAWTEAIVSTREPWNPRGSKANERLAQHSSRPTR